MLFKALIERLLGSNGVQDWKDLQRTKISRFTYSSYPNLINILSNILDNQGTAQGTSDNVQPTEGVFPALQILQQAPPLDSHRVLIQSSVVSLAKSSHWHLRDMAARTLASLLRPTEHHVTIPTLIGFVETSHNARHGILLCLRYLLNKRLKESHYLTSGKFPTCRFRKSCPCHFLPCILPLSMIAGFQHSRFDPPPHHHCA